MTITTKLEDITTKGVNIGVHIHKEKPHKVEGIPEALGDMFADVYESMEIRSILKALKDENEMAFNHAMEVFIEGELTEAEEDEDNE